MFDENITNKSNAPSKIGHFEMRMSSAIKNRRILLKDDVDSDSIFEATYFINKLVSIDEKRGKIEPIRIDIGSYGGTIYDGLELISLIESLKEKGYKITTVVTSYAMSMGQSIALVGSERLAYKHASFMIHTLSSGNRGKLMEMVNNLEECMRLWDVLKKHISKYSNISEDKLDEIAKNGKDWYFGSEDALKLGVIDAII